MKLEGIHLPYSRPDSVSVFPTPLHNKCPLIYWFIYVFHAVIASSSPSSSLWRYGKAWYGVFDALEFNPQWSLNWNEPKYLYAELACSDLSKGFDHSITDIWVIFVNAKPTQIHPSSALFSPCHTGKAEEHVQITLRTCQFGAVTAQMCLIDSIISTEKVCFRQWQRTRRPTNLCAQEPLQQNCTRIWFKSLRKQLTGCCCNPGPLRCPKKNKKRTV